jgi:diaminohydroxyphosphoribosylaminopyrimidine deaminase/5-amino-6-(5-phosphoribosylamino)uracil reductase
MVGGSDSEFMSRALFLAERGRGRTSPNPIVGAVVVSPDGVVVGQGAHLDAGGPHAEVVALDAAGPRAEGATLYCTLEPCAHTGRTGPCAERILTAGIRRVVGAISDPNPRVVGGGFAWLRAHGIDVVEGPGADEAARHHAPFFTWAMQGRPLVIAKAAVSRDGFVGRADERIALTGPSADRYFHRQRAEVDALAVGSGTLLVDDPRLTPRGAYRFRPLTRVLFDWRARAVPSARVFSTLDCGPVIMFVAPVAGTRAEHGLQELVRRGVEVVVLGGPDLRKALSVLGARGVVSLLVEGGPSLHTALLTDRLVDRIQWMETPCILGHGIRLAPAFALERARARAVRVTAFGDDRLTEFDVHRTD